MQNQLDFERAETSKTKSLTLEFSKNIFMLLEKESTRPLQFFCKSLPLNLLLDQRKLLLWINIRQSHNIVLETLSSLNYYELVATCSKYNTDASHMSENIVKHTIWCVFSDTLNI